MIKKILKKIIDTKTFCIDYFIVQQLFKEVNWIFKLIRYKRQYVKDPEVLLSQLRTSAHIIDKGLQAEDWEQGRSIVFYKKLCELILQLQGSIVSNDPSYQWALQKKIEYEKAQEAGYTGYPTIKNTRVKVSKDDLLELIKGRRSVRSFIDRSIGEDVLRELADVVSWSPTSCNRQPAKLFLTQNPDKVAICLNQCAGATCFSKTNFNKARPCFISVCADARLYMIQDRYLPLIDVSLGLQNMLLLAYSQGIEGTILNWMHHTAKEDSILRKTLNIPGYYLIAFNVLIGYSDKAVPVPKRKSRDLAYEIVL